MLKCFVDKDFREKTLQQVYENEHLLYDIVRKKNQLTENIVQDSLCSWSDCDATDDAM